MIDTEQARRERTGTPDKYPQGYFKDKDCRQCGSPFSPQAPSQLYCGEPCAEEAHRERYYQRTYGIGVKEWRAMHEDQAGLCAICLGEGFHMREDHQQKLMVDHCHDTGQVRGLLCHNCNRALGLLQDSKRIVKRVLEYLERATTIREE